MDNMDKMYLDMIDKSPVPCILGFMKKEMGIITDFIIEYSNMKMKELIGEESITLVQAFKLNDLNNINNEILKLKDAEEYEIDMYMPKMGKYYNVSINKLDDNKFAIWLTREVCALWKCEKKCPRQEKLFEIVNKRIQEKIVSKDRNGIITYCNEAFAKSYNTNIENILGKVEGEISREIKPSLCDYMNEDEYIMLSKEEKAYYSKLENRNGEYGYLETIKIPFFDKYNEVDGLLAITRDISSSKKLNLEFDRLRTEFFANLSHEFMTPLNVIFSALQMINKTFESCSGSEHMKYYNYIKAIDKNALRLLKLVNNLIDCTKMDAGLLEFNPATYDIVRFVENIFDSTVEFAKKNNINMIFDTTMEEKIISFDLNKIEKVVLNIISNAIKFNDKNGEINVVMKENKDFVEIIISNTGIGIEENKLKTIFEKFGQANSRLTKISEGSGIGLALTKSLVELHGGSIEVRSEVNKWTEFVIKLPNIVYEDAILVNEYMESHNYLRGISVEFSDIYLNQNI